MINPGQELSTIDFASMIGGPLTSCVDAQAQAAMSTVNFIKAVGFNEDNEPIYVSFKYDKEVSPFIPGTPAGITSIEVTAPGSGYAAPPSVDIDNTGSGGSGLQAQATIEGGKVTKITITDPGTGYTGAPAISLTPVSDDPGTGATATATHSSGTPNVEAQYRQMMIEVPMLSIVPIPYIRIDEVDIKFHAQITTMEYKDTTDKFGVDASLEFKQRWPGGSVKLNASLSYQKSNTQGEKVDRTYALDIHVHASQDELPGGMEKILGILEDSMKSKTAPQTT